MASKIDMTKEIVFGSSDPNVSRLISAYEKSGNLRKIAPRLYTTNMVDSDMYIVRRNIIDIIVWKYPQSIISHRSAKELKPTENGDFFLTSANNRKVTNLPGITIHLIKGPAAIEEDVSFHGLFISCEYRWVLENLQPARTQGGSSKVLPQSVLEDKLEKMLLLGGESKLNEYRDNLREISQKLGMKQEFEKVNKIIGAILNTHLSNVLVSSSAKAYSAGLPFDRVREATFEALFHAVKDRYFVERAIRNADEGSFRLFSFFESYFSNYIEGTKFEVEEAKQMVDSGIVIARRDEDSHDVLGTFNILSNRSEMSRVPESVDELLSILQRRHAVLLAGRPGLNPGMFKTINNRAGNTEFVDHRLVKGTLSYGFKYYLALSDPFAKALYMMFLISEVHPFMDGNGRLARVMMNAELFSAGQTKIIIPTVFRDDYVLSLRKLTRQSDPGPYIRVMEKLHRFSDNLYGADFKELKDYLKQCNAFDEPTEAKLEIIERAFNVPDSLPA